MGNGIEKEEKKILENFAATELFRAILTLKNVDECRRFFRDVCTIGEIREISARLQIARKLSGSAPPSYEDIAEQLTTSTATVTRVAHWLHHGRGGYPLILKRLGY
ncbi:hypothetical protein COU18_03050 [Candidatus Kaiserbacteria bacterium CG10_big_fil_rev_8_21_14_0_10_51_14]|uniref:TrpR-like protein YerC/YecD n=1 Tax=Candidatus Kaiserbacteria bacterium CG10_big_fil_rev_8_21_14_0_10_51_14 TaxID=1974610 RepID=A0A2H0UCX7_9BACT|nr:MAG: hypothetical protein COU18_03050 [Candidatus Kaiserbacteria bacterium CG10_big_fil_rev_8_21_14_0_10_51_14]